MMLVVIPTYNCNTLQRAVDSVLNQSYGEYELLVINDGGRELDLKPHPKLNVFNLDENRGRYFADAIALTANPYDYYFVHDADDASHPDRFAKLVHKQAQDDADFTYNFQRRHMLDGSIIEETYPLMYKPQTSYLRLRVQWSGLYKTEALRSIGGLHPDVRLSYDVLVINLMRINNMRTACVEEFLYDRYLRKESLTVEHGSSQISKDRRLSNAKVESLYLKCFFDVSNTKEIVESSIDPASKATVLAEAERLSHQMGW